MIFNYNQALTSNFKITLAGIPQLEFYATAVNIPTVTLSPIEVVFQDKRLKVPDNKYEWDDLTINFILDEDLYSYELLKDWNKSVRNRDLWQQGLKDINIIPLDSNKAIEFSFIAEGAWPNMISGWQYTSTSSVSDPITFDVSFSYQNLTINRLKKLDFKIVE